MNLLKDLFPFNNFPLRTIVLLSSSLVLTACVTLPENYGFNEIQQTIKSHSGYDIDWDHQKENERSTRIAQLTQQKMTLENAVQLSLLNNPELLATFENLGIAASDWLDKGTPSNPMLDTEITFPAQGSANLNISIVQELLDLVLLPLKQELAEKEFTLVRLEITGKVFDLIGQTRVAFYQYLTSEERLALRQQVAQSTSASYEFMQRLFDAGNVTKLDLKNEQLMFEQARINLLNGESELFQAREKLNQLMGLWGNQVSWQGPKRLPDLEMFFDVDNLEQKAVEYSLDLEIEKQRLDILTNRLGFTESTSLMPEFELGIVGEREEGEWTKGLEFGLPLPIFEQGQSRNLMARSMLRKQQQLYLSTAIKLRSEARLAREKILMSERLVEHYQKVLLPAQQLVMDESQKNYNAMQIGVFQLLQAKNAQITMAENYLNAQLNFWLAQTQVQQLLCGRMTQFEGFGSSQPITSGNAQGEKH